MVDTTFNVQLIEKELISTEFVEKEILKTELKVIDILNTQTTVTADSVFNEIPVNVGVYPTARFRTAIAYKSGTLKIYLGGLRQIGGMIYHSDREFSLDKVITTEYKILVDYIKK